MRAARDAAGAIGVMGVTLAGVAALVSFGFIISGIPLWMPPSFAPNWRAAGTNQPAWSNED